MKVWRIAVDTARSQWNERSTHLVQAETAAKAIEKACAQARKEGAYKAYDAVSVELVGDPL